MLLVIPKLPGFSKVHRPSSHTHFDIPRPTSVPIMADREASLSSGAIDDGDHKELAIKKEANSKLWIKSNGKVDWHAVYTMFSALFVQGCFIYFFTASLSPMSVTARCPG
ncbi:hypothetical protein K456DRAFT_1736386 [Colletotrichum gloeosporioides 23]|nr:hypothetical protein K456DRAFT_1736386 [Colletotrichum gloeosporioides 23]